MEIHVFGSVVRGEIDQSSDIDLLVLKDIGEIIPAIGNEQFSIYTFQRIDELWNEGNPFAWHLYKESKCLYSPNPTSFLKSLGQPQKYQNMIADLNKFRQLFTSSSQHILDDPNSIDFDLSMIFLSIRNFASCFALGFLNEFIFCRDSALQLGDLSINMDINNYNRIKNSRLLATRGIGEIITKDELNYIMEDFPVIQKWFDKHLIMVNNG